MYAREAFYFAYTDINRRQFINQQKAEPLAIDLRYIDYNRTISNSPSEILLAYNLVVAKELWRHLSDVGWTRRMHAREMRRNFQLMIMFDENDGHSALRHT